MQKLQDNKKWPHSLFGLRLYWVPVSPIPKIFELLPLQRRHHCSPCVSRGSTYSIDIQSILSDEILSWLKCDR